MLDDQPISLRSQSNTDVGVVQTNTPPPELFAEHSILLTQILNRVAALLLTHPASK
jgi:hypothetical protein